MSTYPASPKPQFVNRGYNELVKFNTEITSYASGKEQRKRRWANGVYKNPFVLNYDTLNKTNCDILWDFFIARSGSYESFTYVDEINSSSFTVRFANDTLRRTIFSYSGSNPIFEIDPIVLVEVL